MSEAKKPKVGDTVHVRGEVVEILSQCMDVIRVNFSGNSDALVPLQRVVSIEPRPLKVGDRVKLLGASRSPNRTILCIDGDMAWAKRDDDGTYAHWMLSDLERVS